MIKRLLEMLYGRSEGELGDEIEATRARIRERREQRQRVGVPEPSFEASSEASLLRALGSAGSGSADIARGDRRDREG